MPVWLVADGEAGHVLPVATPDVPGRLGVERLQVTDRVGWGAEHAQRVDDLHPGRGGEGKQVIDSGEAIAARTGRDQLIHRAPADSEAAQSQITRKGDERAVSRSEQAARHTGVAGTKRPPFETQPSEIIRNHRPGMLTVNGDRYGMGACPGAPRHGRGRNHPHPQPGRLESASYRPQVTYPGGARGGSSLTANPEHRSWPWVLSPHSAPHQWPALTGARQQHDLLTAEPSCESYVKCRWGYCESSRMRTCGGAHYRKGMVFCLLK